MFELTINGKVYGFNFGMGFMREVNKKISQPVEGLKGVEKNIGLQYMIAGIIDEDIEILVDVLDAANKGNSPRITKAEIDSYIDDENTDIEALFAEVLDFLRNANATKKVVAKLLDAVEKEKAKAEAAQ